MIKPLSCKLMLMFLIVLSVQARALPFENADAFSGNDNLAMRDLESGLVWLDFGVNNGESINSVVDNLNGIYSDWRLPTEMEVKVLWAKLIANNATEGLWGLFNIWGANKTPAEHLPYLSWGYFLGDDGFLGAASIQEMADASGGTGGYYGNSIAVADIDNRIIDLKYDASDYYLFDLNGAFEISTLLVKKANFSEPSSPLLFFSVLLVLLMRRKMRISI